jgi:hypothetical protein
MGGVDSVANGGVFLFGGGDIAYPLPTIAPTAVGGERGFLGFFQQMCKPYGLFFGLGIFGMGLG